jgi:hypothetical protein
MEVVWAGTLWALWCCWLLCQHARAPAALTRTAMTLLVSELVLLAVHSYGCADGCGASGRIAGSAASFDVPALTAVFVAVATVRAWRRAAAQS